MYIYTHTHLLMYTCYTRNKLNIFRQRYFFGYSREPTSIFPEVPGRTLFRHSVEIRHSCGGPISVDLVRPQPTILYYDILYYKTL